MSDEATTSLHIVDDEDLVRNSLATVLSVADYDVDTFSSGVEYLKALPGLNPDCVILDVRMPQMSGLDVLEIVKQHKPSTPVIMISGVADIAIAVKAMQSGAADFIEKPFEPDAVLKVVKKVCESANATSHQSANTAEIEAVYSSLTERETEVLSLLVKGDQNKVVAHKLGISPRTVEVHRARIMQRLGATSFAELVRMTVLSGLKLD
jgi:two-component system response regulator FixJ